MEQALQSSSIVNAYKRVVNDFVSYRYESLYDFTYGFEDENGNSLDGDGGVQLLIDIMKTQTETIDGNSTFISEFELGNKLIKDIQTLLKENIYSNISIDYICEKTHYSKSYIFKQFKKQTDKTIIEYYVNLKINEAKKLIKQNVYSINEIADKLCFDTPNYFSKTFKKITGITPTMYKKMNTKL